MSSRLYPCAAHSCARNVITNGRAVDFLPWHVYRFQPTLLLFAQLSVLTNCRERASLSSYILAKRTLSGRKKNRKIDRVRRIVNASTLAIITDTCNNRGTQGRLKLSQPSVAINANRSALANPFCVESYRYSSRIFETAKKRDGFAVNRKTGLACCWS